MFSHATKFNGPDCLLVHACRRPFPGELAVGGRTTHVYYACNQRADFYNFDFELTGHKVWQQHKLSWWSISAPL